MSKTPSGGPSTIGGVIYQMLWCLLRLSRMEIQRVVENEPGEFTESFLVLEPAGGGGDVQERRDAEVVITQIKSRSDEGAWSLQEVVKEVFPDLLKAVKLDGTEPRYEFVTEGHVGDWDDVEEWFGSLRSRDPHMDPMAELTGTRELRIGGRPAQRAEGTHPFWTKKTYREAELFSKIVNELSNGQTGDERRQLELRVWRLLAHFKFRGGLTRVRAEAEIDANLSQVIDQIEMVREKRGALLEVLAAEARAGNAQIEIGTFFDRFNLRRLPSDRVSELLSRAEKLLRDRLTLRGYTASRHVQREHTDELLQLVSKAPILVLTGRSGSGKSWHAYALAAALARKGELVAHVEAAGSAPETLSEALGTLWNTAKEHDAVLHWERMATRLPGPPPLRVLIVDNVEDTALARALALTPCESLGLQLVLACRPEIAAAIKDVAGERCQVTEVPPFSPAELTAYLMVRQVERWEEIPPDVRSMLSSPLLATLYCDTWQDQRWKPTNEYELFQVYWESRLEGNAEVNPTLDLALLRELGRNVVSGAPYPWCGDLVYGLAKDSEAINRLRRAGWLMVHSGGDCSLWHDRLLNWLVAVTLVEDLRSGAKEPAEVAAVCAACANGQLRASGRSLGYVPMDTLWLLDFRKLPPEAPAAVLAALEQSNFGRALYSKLVPTLGTRAVAGLLARLDHPTGTNLPNRAFDLASCLAGLDCPEVAAVARKLLGSDDPERRSVALRIFSRIGDPAALDQLWALHVRAEAQANQDFEYPRRMDALALAIAAQPGWLEMRIGQATTATPRLHDLVYQLARLEGGESMWRRLKPHLKRVVPEEKRRCLVRCIDGFRDREELEFVRQESSREEDFAGYTAIATLSQMDSAAAIAAVAHSGLRYLASTRGWLLHPLLVARPEETRAALRLRTTTQKRNWELCHLYGDAENEIDSVAFDLVLDHLEHVLAAEIDGAQDPNSGPLHGPLSFIERICTPELLERLRARRGGQLPSLLGQYLLAIGPRNSVSSRLTDRPALRVLQLIGDPALSEVIKAWLRAPSWYGRIDGLAEAHKHADDEIRELLREVTLATPADDNGQFEAYLATHGLCHLGEWDTVLEALVRHGLALSPYLFEQRRGKAPLRGAVLDALLGRVTDGEESSGLLLAAAVSRDERFIPFVRAALLRSNVDRNTFLSAAIAADMLGLRHAEVVVAMASRLDDPSLHDRMLEFLLAMETAESLETVADHLETHFDPAVCAALGRHEAFALRAAEIAWADRDAAARSLGFSLVFPLMGKLDRTEVASYLERFAFGHGGSPIDPSVRAAAVEGLAELNHELAFEAASGALNDPLEENRDRYAELLTRIDPERAAKRLLERLRLEEDEEVEIAIADALHDHVVDDELLALLESADPAARRTACAIACRRSLSDKLGRALRDRALDVNEKVAAAAVRAVREDLRARGVEALVHEVVAQPPGERRWVLLALVAQGARGTKDRAPIRASLLTELGNAATPLEGREANEVLRKGGEEFRRAVRDRARRKSGR